ncbi:hypothetical protein AMJ40_01830 [candidate division TA06 bacterium DG_26]|uniref:DUF4097 domain-containing protein n=1 Tax=candidate division TA06 bacterium DG_26 TaxID=1703771 RepID=A0A0S7WL51_UNCT6|nr:MAG: hypothetical protein AMJ40_01830 [candidate division TA06 bacterium DG_26]
MTQQLSIGIISLFVSFSILVCGCRAPRGEKVTEEFTATYAVEPGTEIAVYNQNGTVSVSTWDGDEVQVYAQKTTRRGEQELKKVRVDVTVNGKMVIRTVYDKRNANVSVSYEIRTPAETVVTHVENSNGKIELYGTKGDAVVKTSNGRVDIGNVDGHVTAETSNGKIKITGTEIFRAQTSNGDVEVELLQVNEDVDIETSNGSIVLHVAADLDSDVEMETTNGRVSVHDVEIAMSESSTSHAKGRMGNGGKRIHAKTSNGNIDVYELKTGEERTRST